MSKHYKRQIHQILPALNFGDAIGNEALEIKSALNSLGYISDIYAGYINPNLGHIGKKYDEYIKISSSENIVIFHFAISSDVSEFVKKLPDKKILIYHNITPSSFFNGICVTFAKSLNDGRKELMEFIDGTNLALGDSEYNRNELIGLGFKNTGVLPLLIDFKTYDQEPDKNVLNKFADDYTNFIFVGRLAPNKKQEDVIKVFYYYNKCINPHSRLFLIGSYDWTTEIYYKQLVELVNRLNLEKDVHIAGHVQFNELLAYYKLSDIFISMSEHEGFCVPLLESMYFEIPIIAYNSTAIPYTLNDAGVLVNAKAYDEVAEMANLLIQDKKIRSKIIEKQNLRLKQFEKSNIEKLLKKFIEEVKS